jgi:hypothetical protein
MEAPSHEGWDVELIDDGRPLLPDGKYEAAYLGHETAFVFQNAKVFLRFCIVTPGDYFGMEVFRAYRANRLVGKPCKNGKFKLRRGSDLFTDVARLLNVKARPDRISLQSLKGETWVIKTRTVVADYKQRPLPEWARYSVVDEILGAMS